MNDAQMKHLEQNVRRKTTWTTRVILNQLRRILNSYGIIAFKSTSHVYLPEEDSYRVLSKFSKRPSAVIIDGGAHHGAAADALSRLLPGSEIHCFEPDPESCKVLQSQYSHRFDIRIVGAALGERSGSASLHVNSSRATNSILPFNSGKQEELESLCSAVEEIDVTVTTIDHYCRENGITRVDLIKLDLQGYDYNALLGAESVLEHANAVMVEVLFEEIYKGCQLFPEMLRFMNAKGYKLYTLSGLRYGANDELVWGDAIFVKGEIS